MELSADACGAIATLIPVYLLVLHVGTDRLVRFRPSGRSSDRAMSRALKAEILIQVALLTTAEVLCLWGLVGEAGLAGLAAQLVIWPTIGLVVGTALHLAIAVLLREGPSPSGP